MAKKPRLVQINLPSRARRALRAAFAYMQLHTHGHTPPLVSINELSLGLFDITVQTLRYHNGDIPVLSNEIVTIEMVRLNSQRGVRRSLYDGAVGGESDWWIEALEHECIDFHKLCRIRGRFDGEELKRLATHHPIPCVECYVGSEAEPVKQEVAEAIRLGKFPFSKLLDPHCRLAVCYAIGGDKFTF